MAVSEACLKLTIFFGERDRAWHRFLADVLTDIYARHQLRASLVMRGVEGFGVKHHLHTDRLLTLSEDLPLVSVAVDAGERIERVLDEVGQLSFDGLVTLERARMVTGRSPDIDPPPEQQDAVKLTVYIGRYERANGRLAYEAVVELLRERGVAGATVLLGVDGTVHGRRRRARFLGANAHVPMMVIAVGDAQRVTQVLPDLTEMLTHPLITLERVRVCKRDGRQLAEPQQLPETDPGGLGVWQKLMVYAGEQARSGSRLVHHELIRELRQAGASGATSLRGIWGYHGDHPPHGDSFWQLQRRVPVVTVIVDTPGRISRWYESVDELTSETGLVTSEVVPAFRATGPGLTHGGLELARLM
jgi:PII-like signaling protein